MKTSDLFPIAILLACIMTIGSVHAQHLGRRKLFPRTGIHYVQENASGLDNGATWPNAFHDLQDALALAKPGDQIWVAAGLYVPTAPGGPQAATFLIPSGVKLYGGFRGDERRLTQRNIDQNPTVLSGDINRDDIYGPFNIVSGNSWNVVTMMGADANTRIDGFEVIGGHLFNAPFNLSTGAGMHFENSSPTVANCSFSFCVSTSGGAIYANLGTPVIDSCSFSNNFASGTTARGAAVANDGGNMLVVRCDFSLNFAQSITSQGLGGALSSRIGSAFVDECTFSGNMAFNRGNNGFIPSFGGAVFVESGFARISNSVFTGNQSNVGGAISTSTFAVANCELLNNIFSSNSVSPIRLGSGLESGGAAGTIYNGSPSNVDVIGCLVYGGSADNTGGLSMVGTGRVANSIFWNNSDNKGTIGRSQLSADLVENCCVMNMLIGEPGEDPPEPQKFPGSIDQDPMFTNAQVGDFHLLPTSPCIDAGDNSLWPGFLNIDFDGNARYVDVLSVIDTGIGPTPIADMGPFEKSN